MTQRVLGAGTPRRLVDPAHGWAGAALLAEVRKIVRDGIAAAHPWLRIPTR